MPQVPRLGLDPDLEAIEEYRKKYPCKAEEFIRRTMVSPVRKNMFLSL